MMKLWNPPNLVTMGRVAIVPVVVLLLFNDGVVAARVAGALFIVAALADIFDGYLARKMGIESTFGAFMDPLADKLMVTSSLVMLIPLGRIPAWLVVLLISRELAVTGLRAIATSEGMIIAASDLGKYKTAFQMSAISYLLLHFPILGFDLHHTGTWLIFMAAVISIFSGLDYAVKFVQFHQKAEAEAGQP